MSGNEEESLGAELGALDELLSERTKQILIARTEGQTLDIVGNQLGVTRERVRQIEAAGNAVLAGASQAFLANVRAQLKFELILVAEPDPERERTQISSAVVLSALGFRRPAVWGHRAKGWWTLDPQEVQRRLQTLVLDAPIASRDLGASAEYAEIPLDSTLLQLLGSPSSPLVQDINSGFIRKRAKTADSAFLWLEERQAPQPIEAIAEGCNVESPRALSERLRSDPARFVQIRPDGTWALKSWIHLNIGAGYGTATEAVIDILKTHGPMTVPALTSLTQRSYPVTVSRIYQVLSSSSLGQWPDGRVDLAERGAPLFESNPPTQPTDMHLAGEIIGVRLLVTPDVLRGSGIGVSHWLSWQLGMRHFPDLVRFDGEYPVVVRRHSSGTAVSSIREFATEHSLSLGCSIVILLNTKSKSVVMQQVCDENCVNHLAEASSAK